MTRSARPSTRRIVKTALERDDGINTLLLDLKQDVGFVSAQVENIMENQKEAANGREAVRSELGKINHTVGRLCETIERIEPIVSTLHTEYQQKLGIGRMIKRGHIAWTACGGAVLGLLYWIIGWAPR